MQTSGTSRHSTAGFSLLEALAVLIIIGILGALAAPGWLAFMNRQRAVTAIDQVQQALRETQAEAKRQRRRRTIQFYSSADSNSGTPEVEVNGIRQILGEGEIDPGNIELLTLDDGGTAIETLVFREDGSLSVEDTDYAVPPPQVPVRIIIESPAGTATKRCVIIETILGSMRSERDGECTP